ncbi:alcohol dehydrogenase catalytic domain-containing protein [Bartonella krasnovii]|nr:alcohol dehydrogenase catalytic domain-containing protein [Bartonella krasnovii]
MAFAKRKMPLIIGAEASGEVVQVGDNIENLQRTDCLNLWSTNLRACQACHEGRDNLCTDVKSLRFSS